MKILATCLCGNIFNTTTGRQRDGRGKYCSKRCSYERRGACKPRTGKTIKCFCGVDFWAEKNEIKKGRKFCSRICCSKSKEKGGWINVHGYRQHGNNLLEHRTAVERIFGRKLLKREVVHHVNEDRADNRIENLQYFRHGAAHTSIHHFARRHGIKDMSIFRVSWEELYGV